jgi:serine/threonine protein kinase
MGEVYLAEHPRLPRRDALKVLPADVSADPDYRARFNREADLASSLWHPHIISVHDRGDHNGQLWISMDFVDGLDAGRLLADRFPAGMPVEEVVRIVSAVAAALDYAHKQGLLHRDVKPSNIMLSRLDEDDKQRILLADFGIARNVDDISGLTTTNMTVGTVAYSAPEQLMGEDIDGRADQYALAATAYHLVTGSQLFQHSNAAVVISRHLNSPPPALADSRPELAALDPVLAVALAKDPDDRFARCAEFARALAEQSYAQGSPSPVVETKPAPVPPAWTHGVSKGSAAGRPSHRPAASGSRRRWLVPVATLAVILLASIIALAWRPWASRQSTGKTTTSAPQPSYPPTTFSAAAPPPAPSKPSIFPAKEIDSVLLSADEVNSILGTYAMSGDQRVGQMKVDRSTYGMVDNSNLVKPPSCVGVVFGAEHEVYADTGFDAMHDQTLTKEPYVYNATGSAPEVLEQTVIVFPSADQAQTVVASAQNQWRSCATGEVDQKAGPESGYGWKLGDVQLRGELLTVSMASNGAITGPTACQQVLGARDNVVVGIRSCSDIEQSAATNYDPIRGWPTDPRWATNDAGRMADAMLEKVKVLTCRHRPRLS